MSTLPPNILAWNTGRWYTDAGQRIIAMRLFNGGIVFYDIDREIMGHWPYAVVAEKNIVFGQQSILYAYDQGGDLHPYWSTASEHTDLFVALKALAEQHCPRAKA